MFVIFVDSTDQAVRDQKFRGRSGNDTQLEPTMTPARIHRDMHLDGAVWKPVAPADIGKAHLKEGGHTQEMPGLVVPDPDPLSRR